MGFFAKRKETRRAAARAANNANPNASARLDRRPLQDKNQLEIRFPDAKHDRTSPAGKGPADPPSRQPGRRGVGRIDRSSRVVHRRKSTATSDAVSSATRAPQQQQASAASKTPASAQQQVPTRQDALSLAMNNGDLKSINDLIYEIARSQTIDGTPISAFVLSPRFAMSLLNVVDGLRDPAVPLVAPIPNETRGNAAWLISELAIASANSATLVNVGAVAMLLRHARTPGQDSRLMYFFLRGLRNTLQEWRDAVAADNTAARAKRRDKDQVPTEKTNREICALLLSVIREWSNYVQIPHIYEETLGALLEVGPDDSRRLLDLGIVGYMVQMWRGQGVILTEEARLYMASILAKLSAGMDASMEPGQFSHDVQMDVAAMKALSKAASQVIKTGALDFAIDGMRTRYSDESSQCFLAECARVMMNLCFHPAGRKACLDRGAFDVLFECFEANVGSTASTPAFSTIEVVNALGQLALDSAQTASEVYTSCGQKLLRLIRLKNSSAELLMSCREALIQIAQSSPQLLKHLLKSISKFISPPDSNIPKPEPEIKNRLLDFKQEIELRCSEDYRDELPRNDMAGVVRASIKLSVSFERGSSSNMSAEPNRHRYLSVVDDLSDPELQNIPRGSYVQSPAEPKTKQASYGSRDGSILIHPTHKNFFEICEEDAILGKGGYGIVYKARDMRHTGPEPKFVAIKQIDQSKFVGRDEKERNERVMREVRVWRKLDHPNVVKYITCFKGDEDEVNLVAEFIDGLNLSELRLQYSFPENVISEVVSHVLNGLEYIHSKGVIHRDLKPANLLVSPEKGRIKLADFGVSWSSEFDKSMADGTTIVGTPAYLSPEMLDMTEERGKATNKIDIWALGSCIFELVTGKRPYHELSGMEVLLRIMQDRHPDLPSDISEELFSFMKACWTKDPAERPSATELKRHPFVRRWFN